jgi:hypothetical protein
VQSWENEDGSSGRELGTGEIEMLAAIAYNQAWQQLYLKFRSGDIYCYRGVPAELYQELVAAGSKGSYVRRRILNRYPYQRVHSLVSAAS